MSQQASKTTTWLIVGASRGIGLEFVRQLLETSSASVIATVRDTSASPLLQDLVERHGGGDGPKAQDPSAPAARLRILPCDITSDVSIAAAVAELSSLSDGLGGAALARLDYVVINAGVMKYPNRASEVSFDDFAFHLHTNAIGPIVTARTLLQSALAVGTIVFMSSDSGSAIDFREMEDGFAAYASSKAALNQALRHMAAELRRKGKSTVIVAMHPGEVSTDMANIDLPWEVKGVISARESVSGMIGVIESKSAIDSGTFWTWEGKQHPW